VNDDVWIFGYGSLVWRPDFPFAESRPARLDGWVRRFWQGSTDHRGVPGAPGRVVTLVRDGNGTCRGMAYRINTADVADVLVRLDYREKGGYALERVKLGLARPDDSSVDGQVDGLVYIAMPDNPNYLGPAETADIARQVRRATGPSGDNVEYVLRLAAALREIGAHDPHVFELERLVRQA
jgi:cation transport regulator ChaC